MDQMALSKQEKNEQTNLAGVTIQHTVFLADSQMDMRLESCVDGGTSGCLSRSSLLMIKILDDDGSYSGISKTHSLLSYNLEKYVFIIKFQLLLSKLVFFPSEPCLNL